MQAKYIVHPWEPLYNVGSRVLILGTIPSPKSREMGFYYGHPQNIFWRTLAAVLDKPEPPYDVRARREFALENRIALWDVLRASEISGASDMSIRNPVPNQFSEIIKNSDIRSIFTTGKKATELFNSLCAEESGVSAIYLPSTSPANRAFQAKPEFMALWRQVAGALNDKDRSS